MLCLLAAAAIAACGFALGDDDAPAAEESNVSETTTEPAATSSRS